MESDGGTNVGILSGGNTNHAPEESKTYHWLTAAQYSGGIVLDLIMLPILFVMFIIVATMIGSIICGGNKECLDLLWAAGIFGAILTIIWIISLKISRRGYILVNIPDDIHDIDRIIGRFLFDLRFPHTRRSKTGRLPWFPQRYQEVFSIHEGAVVVRIRKLSQGKGFTIPSKSTIEMYPVDDPDEPHFKLIRTILNRQFDLEEPRL